MTSSLVKVGDLCEQIRGVTYSKGDAVDKHASGYLPILRATNITDRGLTYKDLVFVPTAKISARQMVRANDVVIAASSGSLDVVGKAARALKDFQGSFGAFCKVLRPNGKVDPSFFAHFFQTQEYRRRVSSLAAGTNINNLRNEHLGGLQINLPPLLEQRRIAAILDKADALRAKRREAIAKLDQLLQSVFLEMFGDPVTNPKRWPLRPFTKVGAWISGATPSKSEDRYWGGTIPWVSPKDMKVASIDDAEDHVSDAAFKESTLKRVPPGHLLIVVRGMILAHSFPTAINSVPIAINQDMKAIRPGRDFDVTYLKAAVDALKARILGVVSTAGHGTRRLGTRDASEILVPAPPVHLQVSYRRIAELIRQLFAQSRRQELRGHKLFGSLQHQAFSGAL